MIWPALIAHADWGTDARKRQVAVARLTRANGGGHAGYVVESLAPAPGGRWLFGQLAADADPGQAMIGFDFPIGLPRAYAAAAGITAFPTWLETLGTPPWESFHLVAGKPEEITLHRPFYPMRPGGTRREHLYLALQLSARDLRRRCEGNDAEALFWTLGGKQVGKGALIGWQLIAAARRAQPGTRLWPFDGPLSQLLKGQPRTVVAETYPREYYRHLGPAARWSKRRRADRLRQIPGLFSWAGSLPVEWDASIHRRVESGFSDDRNGEDEFDAVIGLLAMIAVVTGALDAGVPDDDPEVLCTEGWILGRPADRPASSRLVSARGDEERVVAAFAGWLRQNGWTVKREVDFVDVYAKRGAERMYAEAKGRTAAIGLDVDTLYGQLLRRMKDPAAEARYAVVVPTAAVAAADRVPAWVRDRLAIHVYEVDDLGAVRPHS